MTSGVADRNAARSASAGLEFVARRVAATEAVMSTAQFTADGTLGNSLDPDGPVETRLVMTNSLIRDWYVADMKLHVESVEIDVLRGCARAVQPPHRTDPARMERDVVIGARSQPAPSGRSARTTQLSAIPAQPTGTPAAATDPGFGAGILPVSQRESHPDDVRTYRRSEPMRTVAHWKLYPLHPAEWLFTKRQRVIAGCVWVG